MNRNLAFAGMIIVTIAANVPAHAAQQGKSAAEALVRSPLLEKNDRAAASSNREVVDPKDRDAALVSTTKSVFALSKKEGATLAPLQKAVAAQDWARAAAAFPAAQAVATGPDAKYLLAAMQLKMALGAKNLPGQITALEAMIASGKVPQADLPTFKETLVNWKKVQLIK